MTLETHTDEHDDRGDPHSHRYTTPLVAAGLAFLTVLSMYGFAFTPLAQVNEYVFTIPILGIIFCGILLMAGYTIARKGLKTDTKIVAYAGALLLIITYGTFGANAVSRISIDFQIPALLITGAITAAITATLSIAVTRFNADFSSWGQHSSKFFLVGLLAGAVGSVITPILLIAFICFLTGFTLRLAHDVHTAHQDNEHGPYLMAIELYISFVGVFVHLLQVVSLADR